MPSKQNIRRILTLSSLALPLCIFPTIKASTAYSLSDLTRDQQRVETGAKRVSSAPIHSTKQLKRPWQSGTLQGAALTSAQGSHDSPVRTLAFSPDGAYWASGGADGTVKIWNFDPVQNFVPPPIQELSNHPDHVVSVSFSPDGQWLVSACLDGSILIWDWQTGELIQQFYQYLEGEGRHEIARLAFSPNGQFLVTSMGPRTIKVWEFSSINQGGPLALYGELETTQSVETLAFSPDGNTLASAGLGRLVELWDIENQRLIRTLGHYERAIYDLAFSPDGNYIAFSPDAQAIDPLASSDNGRDYNTVQLWDLYGEPVGEAFSDHQDYISSVVFSADGQTLLIGSWDSYTTLWDTETGEQVHQFSENSERILSAEFSPTNDRFVLGSADGMVQFFMLKDDYRNNEYIPPARN